MSRVRVASMPIQSLNVSPGEMEEILNRLDGPGHAYEGVDEEKFGRREHKRRRCRAAAMLISFAQPPLGIISYAVRIRNISRGGLSFLHRTMLHRGTPCRMRIRLRADSWIDARGKIVQCRHIDGVVHELGVRFDEPIDLDESAEY